MLRVISLEFRRIRGGNSGSNGGVVTIKLTNQSAKGNIVVDSISTLTMNLTDRSSFEGVINGDNAGEVALALDSSSTLTLTGDTYVKSLANVDATNSNINLNGYKLYINGFALK